MSNTDFEYWDIFSGEGVSDCEMQKRYDDMLDEAHGEFMGLAASNILKSTDPIAYRGGIMGWLDSELGESITDEDPASEDDEDE